MQDHWYLPDTGESLWNVNNRVFCTDKDGSTISRGIKLFPSHVLSRFLFVRDSKFVLMEPRYQTDKPSSEYYFQINRNKTVFITIIDICICSYLRQPVLLDKPAGMRNLRGYVIACLSVFVDLSIEAENAPNGL